MASSLKLSLNGKDGETRGIVAYSGWIDIYDENNNFVKFLVQEEFFFLC